MDTRLLNQNDIERLLTVLGRDAVMDKLIDALHDGFAALGRGEHDEPPPRTGFVRGADVPGVIELMPHRAPGDSVTLKTISYNPENRERYGMPTVVGTLARIDDNSGRLLALADGGLLTAMRTGAVAAVASRLLAAPGSQVLGLVGAGAQAVTQAHGLSRAFPLRKIVVSDIVPEHAASFARRAAFLGLPVEIASPERGMAEADIVSTVTSVPCEEPPVVPDGPHLEHLHVNAMGADEPGKKELPRELLERAFICVDHPGQARTVGEFQQLPDRALGPSLASLCADPAAAGPYAGRLSVLDSTGSAFADHIAFGVLLAFADELGLGHKFALECDPEDALDPYSLPYRRTSPA
ncbi:ornithine cyclodeaminase family protein [Streptomyces sp. NBC_00878]|uniref:ornithine cyclodeaminase family protein n=1 Tax=Streptomyces sp. NBC_00878 TaxID=2975854 RepID=UPI0022500493|nr:ornithine cyclodeaminase family protein [Streptomyces sp. NBC_00878]MCX4911246.1 ornithine cyclodeaminase family protein [Streptomyces sp. NBC_00878]